MTKHIVKCLVCGQSFDTNEEDYRTEGRRYIHQKCIKQRELDSFFIDDIHTYISHMYGTLYSKEMINRQLKEMVKDGKTLENIDRTLKYWYSIKKNDPSKSQGSIRIVNYVYDEAISYYKQKELNANANKGVNIKQMTEYQSEEIIIQPKPIGKPKKVKLFDLK